MASASKQFEPFSHRDEPYGRSLADRLLAIQRHAIVNEKSVEWASNLECLLVPTEAGEQKTLVLKRIPETDSTGARDYVAVSYSCKHMMAFEEEDATGYEIQQWPGDESPKPNKTRNIIIQRAMRYAKWVKSPYLWVDQDCVDQMDDEEKEVAMDSMDLVYVGSKYPVGLMSTVLSTEDEIRMLQALLSSKDASELTSDDQTIEQVMSLLQLFSEDRWWQRAWIFQEEYLAGLKMDVLVRHDPDLELVKRELFSDESEDESESEGWEGTEGDAESEGDDDHILEEVCFRATDLRGAATVFLLALKDSSHERWQQQEIERLLQVFGRYNLLYDQTESANRKAMSARVIADIRARGIGQEYDILPIAANSCNYAIRFDTRHMANSPYSADMCTLAMFLLNGEIISNSQNFAPSSADTKLGEFLDHISFDAFDPPVAARELSWLKNCRLPFPKFVPSGIRTEGYLWTVKDKIYTRNWGKPFRRQAAKEGNYGLNNKQRASLLQLADKLRQRKHWSYLQKKLRDYLRQDFKLQRAPAKESTKAVKGYKDLMAKEVCNAIDAHETLYLATLGAKKAVSAIFVGLEKRDTSIFTAWDYREDEDQRIRTRHLSLIVRREPKIGKQWMPRLKIEGWVNGLVFFTSDDSEKVIMSWPESWLKVDPEIF